MVSLIMPVRNQEQFVSQAISSLLVQTYNNFELIIVNNQSTDATNHVLQGWAKKDNRIKVVESSGLAGSARNLGLQIAKGDQICFVDSDDFFKSTMIEQLHHEMQKNNSEIVICRAYRYNNASKETRIMEYQAVLPDNRYGVPLSPIQDLSQFLFQTTVPTSWAKMFSRSIVEKCGLKFQDLHNSNDILFVFGCLSEATIISYLCDPLVFYRTHIISQCQGHKDAFPLDCVGAYEALYYYLLEKHTFALFKNSFIKLINEGISWNYKSLESEEAKSLLIRAYSSSIISRIK